MEVFETIIRFFKEGGVFMYPIMIVFAIGVAIAIERYVFLATAGRSNKKLWQQLHPVLSAGDLQQAKAISSASPAGMGKVLTYGIKRAEQSQRPEDIENSIEEGLLEVVPRLERRTHYLAAFANVATLLGLLGTIIGLIRAFTAVANAAPADKAEYLSESISVAMNTTAFGLIVAIPLLLMYTFLNTKTNDIVSTLDSVSVKFLNLVSSTRKY